MGILQEPDPSTDKLFSSTPVNTKAVNPLFMKIYRHKIAGRGGRI